MSKQSRICLHEYLGITDERCDDIVHECKLAFYELEKPTKSGVIEFSDVDLFRACEHIGGNSNEQFFVAYLVGQKAEMERNEMINQID